MKKILFFALIGGALLFASCTKHYTQVTPNQTVYADIKPSDWGTQTGGLTDTVVINTPEIDNYFNTHGAVIVALTFDNGVTYEPIPYVFDNINYSYIYTAGGIELFAQSADGTKAITTPEALTAKITLVPSN